MFVLLSRLYQAIWGIHRSPGVGKMDAWRMSMSDKGVFRECRSDEADRGYKSETECCVSSRRMEG